MKNMWEQLLAKTYYIIATYRRFLAATLLTLAALLFLNQAITPFRQTTEVYISRGNIVSGNVIKSSDVTSIKISSDITPKNSIKKYEEIVGEIASGNISEGEIITTERLLKADLLNTENKDLLALPLELANPAIKSLIKPGQYINITAIGNNNNIISEEALKVLWISEETNNNPKKNNILVVAATKKQSLNLQNMPVNISILPNID